jgi:hypothetical protein
MSFQNIAKDYLREMQDQVNQAERTGEFTAELSFRPATHKFFRALAAEIDPEIGVIYEPKKQRDAGHPDWRLYNKRTLGMYGSWKPNRLTQAAI